MKNSQEPRLRSLRHLSRKTLIVTISLLTLSILSIVFMERRSITQWESEAVRIALNAAMQPASTSVEYLDGELAQKITDGLVLLPKIYYSAIEDDFGKRLAETSGEPLELGDSLFMHWLIPLQELHLERDIVTIHGNSGRIVVKAVLNQDSAKFTEKLLLYVIVQGVLSVLLVGLTIHYMAVRPLLKGLQKLHSWVYDASFNDISISGYEKAYAYSELQDLHSIIEQKNVDIESKQRGLELSLERLYHQIRLTTQQSKMLESVLLGSNHALILIGSDGLTQIYDHSTEYGRILEGIPKTPHVALSSMQSHLAQKKEYTLSEGPLFTVQSDESILYELNIVESEINRVRSLMAINVGQGAIAYLVKDITREKELEAQNLQSRKMESLGVLSSGIAHDFNNILSIILADLQLAEINSTEGTEVHKHIGGAIRATERGAGAVRMMLAYSRHEDSKPERFNLKKHLGEFCEFVKNKIGPSFKLSTDMPFDATIEIDPAKLDNTLLNLILNSRDAMGDSGMLEIALMPMDACLMRKAFGPQFDGKPEDYVGITTRDYGGGIPKSDVSRIFDPFYTSKKKHQGTGLGLSISLANIEGVGGRLVLLDNSNKGVRFLVVLPKCKAGAVLQPGSVQAVKQVPSLKNQHSTVLLVEDESQLSKALCRSLSISGIAALPATSVMEAKRVLLNNDEISIVVTDYNLKDETGYELLKFVRQNRNLPVVLMTGSAEVLDSLPVYYSFDDHLVKPFSLGSLNAIVVKTESEFANGQLPVREVE